MTDLDRRRFLSGIAAATAGGAVLSGPLAGYAASVAGAGPGKTAARALAPTPDLRDGVVRLSLPQGFSYRSFHDTSTGPVVLDDGSVLPGRHDGMGAFAGGDGTSILVRNHELNGPGSAFGASGPVYDPAAQGGTTTVEVTADGTVLGARASLSGTQMNCAGGVMPWGSWITCEETVNGPDVYDDFTRGSGNPPETYIQNAQLERPHGFIFEVPADGVASGEPIRNAGRFAHEAVAFDPVEGVLYLTEDNFGFASGFYKYVPPVHPMEAGALLDGGELFMLKVRGIDKAALHLGQPANATYDIEWVRIDEPFYDGGVPGPGETPAITNDEAIQFVSAQGLAQGAATFSRLEGTVYDKNVVYFCSTQGGATPPGASAPFGFGDGRGQIWAYHTRSGKLRLVFESPSADVLDFPDNVTASPGRGTLVVCEDGGDGNYLRGLRRDGTIFDLAKNLMAGRMDDEFAGATFSGDGSTLFVNIQASNGLTFAIRGPWARVGF